MKDEVLIDQIAELRGAIAANTYLLITYFEDRGCDPEALIRGTDLLICKTADIYENQMRKECGLPLREKPRELMLDQMREKGFGSVDWSKMKEN